MQRVGLPRWLYLPAGVGALFVLLPLAAMVARVDWTHFGGLVTSASSRDALWLSLRTSAASTAACVVLGVPMAVVLARTEFRGQAVTRSLVLLPLVIPPVVSGIALLHTFGRRGLLGHTLDVLGIEVAFTTVAVVMAQTFVALPFLVISLEGALRTAGQRYEAVASTLGAGPAIPTEEMVDPALGDSASGMALFRTNCAMCHNAVGAGGALSQGKFAPPLANATPTVIYEAMLTGPQSMPVFNNANITPQEKRDVIAYLVAQRSNATSVNDLGAFGPVSEGLWAWVLGIGTLIGCAVWIGAKSS